jgi:hypothetical protein
LLNAKKNVSIAGFKKTFVHIIQEPLWGVVEKLEICYDDSKLKR